MAQDIIARGMAAEALKKAEEGGGGGATYLHRIYLGNPTECNQAWIMFNLYVAKAEPFANIQELSNYLIERGINNTVDTIEAMNNVNGILCFSLWGKPCVLRKIDPENVTTYILLYEDFQSAQQGYYSMELLEDAVI